MSERRSAIKSIRRFCVDTCCAGDQEAVRECTGFQNLPSVECVLYPYRMGKNPNRKGMGFGRKDTPVRGNGGQESTNATQDDTNTGTL